MKSIGLMGMMWLAAAGQAVAAPNAHLVEMSKKQLVYVNHIGALDTQQQRTFTYNEVVDWAPDYIFVSQMRADCQTKGLMQKEYLMAFHTKALRGQHTPLTAQERQWRTYDSKAPEYGAWQVACRPHQSHPISLHDLFDRYHAFLKGFVVV